MDHIITPIPLGFNGLLLYRDYWNEGEDASLLAPPDIADAYREMADDDTREWDAMEWSEALIGEALATPQAAS